MVTGNKQFFRPYGFWLVSCGKCADQTVLLFARVFVPDDTKIMIFFNFVKQYIESIPDIAFFTWSSFQFVMLRFESC